MRQFARPSCTESDFMISGVRGHVEISHQIPLAANHSANTNAQLLRTSYTESHLMISGVPGHMEISNQNALVIN